jgi:hypothetical protein
VGVSAAVSFSLALILCHELDGDSSPLHHFITIAPCFKKKMGRIKLQVLLFSACPNPCSKFQVVVFNSM